MAPPAMTTADAVNQVDKINYGQSFNVLSRANASKYTNIISHEDLLRESLGQTARDVLKDDQNNLKKFLVMLSNIYQSITTKGLITSETVAYIIGSFERMDLEPGAKQKLLIAMTDYIAIFQVDYTRDKGPPRVLGSNIDSQVYDAFTYSEDSRISKLYGDARKSSSNTVYEVSQFLNFSDSEDKSAQGNFAEGINKNISAPTKQEPNVSVILMNNRNLRTGVKNSLELSTFFNLIPSLEYAKAYPYFNATFILPNISKQDATSVFKSATINQFLFGGSSKNTTRNYERFEARVIKSEENIGVKTNLSVFTSPQTFVNMDEKIGHRDALSVSERQLRITTVHDSTQPFMTLKDFTIDVAPTKGLMSFKTGKMSLVLHDRTRMTDIAPFIKPDLFGAFGAEIVVEYGWNHNESQSSKETGRSNPIGEFLHSSRCVEKYMIVNSQFSVENNGQVNINLSVAMKGPIDIRQTEIFADAIKQVERNELQVAIARYQNAVELATNRASGAKDFSTVNNAFGDLYAGRNVKSDSLKIIKSTQKKIKEAIETYKRIRTDVSSTQFIPGRRRSIIRYSLRGNYFYVMKTFNQIFGFTGHSRLFGLKSERVILNEEEINEANRTGTPPPEEVVTYSYYIDVFSSLIDDDAELDEMLREDERERFETAQAQARRRQKSAEQMKVLINLGDSVIRIRDLIKKFIGQNELIKSLKKDYVKSLIGGTSKHDMFFDKRLIEVINANKDDDAKTNDFIVEKVDIQSYVSLGTIITSLISTHMAKSSKYDEIQLVFNTINDTAGLASCYMNHMPSGSRLRSISNGRPLNIASLLIKRKDLKEFLEKLFNERVRLTLESLISQIITNFIITRDNPCYGLSNLYIRDAFDLPVKPQTKRKLRSAGTKNVKDRLNYIYYKNEKEIYDVEPMFTPPSVHMTFDALTSVDNMGRTICRITIYDRNDNPYQTICDIYNEKFLARSKNLRTINQYMYRIDQENLKPETKRELKDKISRLIDALIHDETGIFEGRGGVFSFKPGFGFDDLKEKYKKLVPSATFATQNTSLINASVATVNEGNLNTIYITRADRNNIYEKNNKVLVDMPLRILPAQASIEMFGCPWINFGQYIFLDFETGTTLDNTYSVTGVKHTIMPGKFSTQVSLSYGDVYGKYEGMADSFSRVVEKFGTDAQKQKSSSPASSQSQNQNSQVQNNQTTAAPQQANSNANNDNQSTNTQDQVSQDTAGAVSSDTNRGPRTPRIDSAYASWVISANKALKIRQKATKTESFTFNQLFFANAPYDLFLVLYFLTNYSVSVLSEPSGGEDPRWTESYKTIVSIYDTDHFGSNLFDICDSNKSKKEKSKEIYTLLRKIYDQEILRVRLTPKVNEYNYKIKRHTKLKHMYINYLQSSNVNKNGSSRAYIRLNVNADFYFDIDYKYELHDKNKLIRQLADIFNLEYYNANVLPQGSERASYDDPREELKLKLDWAENYFSGRGKRPSARIIVESNKRINVDLVSTSATQDDRFIISDSKLNYNSKQK